MDFVPPKDAQALMNQGWVYIDVRTEEEFGFGHPAGALNIPYLMMVNGQRGVNPDFVAAMDALFEKDSPLIFGCASGARSTRAATDLARAGFTQLKVNSGGWSGDRGPSGDITTPGWEDAGLPAETGQPDDRSYQALLKRVQP
jgi:rhodanese-related sulfurtransferase